MSVLPAAADAPAWVCQLADFVVLNAGRWDADAIDTALDSRDTDPFDSDWVHADAAARQHRDQLALPARAVLEIQANDLRKRVFASVLKATCSADAAGYVSDDFELIYLGLASGFSSSFLSAMVAAYQAARIPGNSVEFSAAQGRQ